MTGTWIGLADEEITTTLSGLLALMTAWAVAADDAGDYAIARPLDLACGHLGRAIARMRDVDEEMKGRAAVAAVIESIGAS